MGDPHCPICHEPTDDPAGVDTYGACSPECAAELTEIRATVTGECETCGLTGCWHDQRPVEEP
jgi:hypothetical protein